MYSEMSDIPEGQWKKTLTNIMEELNEEQYEKMLSYLEIPEGKKNPKSKVKMAETIIQHFGVEGSIKRIDGIMSEIPRRDAKMQDLLRPFVDKLRNDQDKENQGKKRKREDEDESNPAAGHQKSSRPAKGLNTDAPPDKNTAAWKISISDLKSNGVGETKGINGKVVEKSGLHKYQTKDKKKKVFFYLAAADDTASVKLMVYGKEHYKDIQVGRSYLFRGLVEDEFCVKVTSLSTVARTPPVGIPDELETEARKLIYPESKVYNISEAKSLGDKTEVSVEGTVTEVSPLEKNVKVFYQKEKTKKQNFQLKDETDSIRICLWGEATSQCRGLAAGDIVKVTNLKTHEYYEDTSLNSTRFTKIQKVKSVGVQRKKIEITGIIKTSKTETQLDVETDGQLQTFVVSTRLLAEALGFSLKDDVEERLLDKMPLFADAEIRGNEIHKIKPVKKD